MHTSAIRLPFGNGWFGVVVTGAVAAVLVNAYFDGGRPLVRGAFALGAVLLLFAQLNAWRRGQRSAG